VLLYLDTPALVKLVVREDETAALLAALAGAELVTSALARTEIARAVTRAGVGSRQARADQVLARTAQLVIDDGTLDHAGTLLPPALRSLDAIHVAAALGLADRMEGLITYDVRMAAAARAHGLTVRSPGR